MMQLAFLFQFAGCALAHLFILFAWHALLGMRIRQTAPAVRLLFSMTLLWVQIVFVVLVLGLTGSLTRTNVVFANLALAAVIIAVTLATGGGRLPIHRVRGSLAGILAGFRSQPAIAFVVCAAGLGFLWYTTLAIFFPPLGYDDLAYHVPGAAFALQNGSLIPIPLPQRVSYINYYPQATEFLSVWCFSLLGSDAMIGIWQCGIYLYFIVACFVLCRTCGCTRSATLFAVSLGAVTPTLLAQNLTTYNDVFVAAFFASALTFAVMAGRRPILAHLLALAVSCGGLMAAKLSGPLLVGAALAVFSALFIRRRFGFALFARSVSFVILVSFTLGGYWYLRNTLSFGNPFYPFQIHVAGLSLPGRIASSTWSADLLNPELSRLPLFERLWRLWLEQKSHYGYWFYSYDSAYAGFGPIWFVLGIPSILVATVLSIAQRNWDRFVLLAVSVLAYLGFSGNISVRYTLYILPAMVLGIAAMVSQMGNAVRLRDDRKRYLMARWSLVGVHSLGVVLVFVTLGLMAFAVKDPAIIRAQVFKSTLPKYQVTSPVMDVFSSMRSLLPEDAVVAFDETADFLYPLWRPDFANKVFFISTKQSQDKWASQAAALKAQYVFAKIGPTTPVNSHSPLADWFAQTPSRFKLIASVPNYGDLYEIL